MPLHQLKSGNLSFNANKWCHTGSFAFANSTLTISNFTAEGESHKNFPSSKGNLLKYSGLSSAVQKGECHNFFLQWKKSNDTKSFRKLKLQPRPSDHLWLTGQFNCTDCLLEGEIWLPYLDKDACNAGAFNYWAVLHIFTFLLMRT